MKIINPFRSMFQVRQLKKHKAKICALPTNLTQANYFFYDSGISPFPVNFILTIDIFLILDIPLFTVIFPKNEITHFPPLFSVYESHASSFRSSRSAAMNAVSLSLLARLESKLRAIKLPMNQIDLRLPNFHL